jgi:hypothetical protein
VNAIADGAQAPDERKSFRYSAAHGMIGLSRAGYGQPFLRTQ